jgi:predicted nucleic-acid-binding Zn-ribbon protein
MQDAINLKIQGIKCDNCDYRDNNVEFTEYEQYLNKPCPWCGAPLLTQADLDATKNIIKLTNAFNGFFEALGFNPIDNEGKVIGKIEMNGTGKATLTIDQE